MASSIHDEVRSDPTPSPEQAESPIGDHRRGRGRRVAAVAVTLSAFALVWLAMVGPNDASRLTPWAFVRIPLEGVLLLALTLVLPRRAGQVLALVVGLLLGVLTVVKILDIGFLAALDRPFNPVSDWSYLGPAVGVLDDSIGRAGAVLSVIGAALLILSIIVLMPLAVRRLTLLGARPPHHIDPGRDRPARRVGDRCGVRPADRPEHAHRVGRRGRTGGR